LGRVLSVGGPSIPRLGEKVITPPHHPLLVRGILILPIYGDDLPVSKLQTAESVRMFAEEIDMHDLLIALAFIGMVVAPAIVAANSSAEVSEDNE